MNVRQKFLGAIHLSLGFTLAFLFATAPCAAALIDLSGRVDLLDGASAEDVKIRLGVDLNRDGKFDSFEELRGETLSDGSFRLQYEPQIDDISFEFLGEVSKLISDIKSRGFEAITDQGALTLVVSFEREGYTTITRRISTLSDIPSFDVVMDKLKSVQCSEALCMSPDGAVRLSGLPTSMGLARAFARAHDPRLHPAFFPGDFADDQDNLLISGGFAEIELRDESGNKITQVNEPVGVRFKAHPTSWASLRDLDPDSGRIEVPMYSFDEQRGLWVSEENGELQDADGNSLPEDAFESIQEGAYEGDVFISFETKHFSTFNCDAPIRERACIKGRLVNDDGPLGNYGVNFEGVNYSGSAGSVVTDASGWFATDVMKSELRGEDVDGNRRLGETFRVQAVVRARAQYAVSVPYDTPSERGSVGRGYRACQGDNCDCEDIGDVMVPVELPRACSVRVKVRASGRSRLGQESPLAAGDIIARAQVSGAGTGLSFSASRDAARAVCSDEDCGSSVADADGVATFVVPIVGDSPIELRASGELSTENGMGGASSLGISHSFQGSIVVEACPPGSAELDATVRLELDHVSLVDLDAQMAEWRKQQEAKGTKGAGGQGYGASGPGGQSAQASGGAFLGPLADAPTTGCGCDMTGRRSRSLGWLALVSLLLPWVRRRKQS